MAGAAVKIGPSLLSADFGRLGEELEAIAEAGADFVHIDVMDGGFVPNITVGVPVVASLRRVSRLPFDVHLMVREPAHLLDAFIDAGADVLGVHLEACPHVHRCLEHIRRRGVRAGLALNPGTPLSLPEALWEEMDQLLIMTVNPGFGGQALIPGTVAKVRDAAAIIAERAAAVDLAVDGGVKPDNAALLREAGATHLVAGTAVFGADDYARAIATLRGA